MLLQKSSFVTLTSSGARQTTREEGWRSCISGERAAAACRSLCCHSPLSRICFGHAVRCGIGDLVPLSNKPDFPSRRREGDGAHVRDPQGFLTSASWLSSSALHASFAGFYRITFVSVDRLAGAWIVSGIIPDDQSGLETETNQYTTTATLHLQPLSFKLNQQLLLWVLTVELLLFLLELYLCPLGVSASTPPPQLIDLGRPSLDVAKTRASSFSTFFEQVCLILVVPVSSAPGRNSSCLCLHQTPCCSVLDFRFLHPRL